MTSLEEEAVELDRAAVRLATIASRAASRVDSAVSELTHGIVSVIKALESARRRFKSESARVASHRSLWLDKQLEECDAVEKSFDSFVRLIDSGALAPDDTLHALASLRQLIDNTAFPRLPVMVAVDPGAIISIKTIISQASRFQSGPSPAHCVLEGIGLEYCCPGLSNHARTRNQLSLTCKDEVNEGIRSLLASDFAVSVEGGAGVTLVSANVVVDVFPNSSLGIVYTVTLPEGKLPDEPTVEICVSLLGCELAKRNIRVSGTYHSRRCIMRAA